MSARAAVFILMAALAAFAPEIRSPAAAPSLQGFPGWPAQVGGRPLTRLPPGPQDEWFARDFPGRIARFSSGEEQVVLRWINAPTRRLHPASHCFEGAGFAVEPRPMRRMHGALAGCFVARRDGESLNVCEWIADSDGRSWSDVSSWYWSALAAPPARNWWSYVVVRRER